MNFFPVLASTKATAILLSPHARLTASLRGALQDVCASDRTYVQGLPVLLNGQGRVQERLVARPDLDRELARLDHPLAVQRPEAELRRVHADRHRLRRAGPGDVMRRSDRGRNIEDEDEDEDEDVREVDFLEPDELLVRSHD